MTNEDERATALSNDGVRSDVGTEDSDLLRTAIEWQAASVFCHTVSNTATASARLALVFQFFAAA